MKNVLFAVITSFSLGFALSAFAGSAQAVPSSAGPQEESCKAAGHACDDKEDCCSRMCRKDNHKCA